jgi:hypothetical protein
MKGELNNVIIIANFSLTLLCPAVYLVKSLFYLLLFTMHILYLHGYKP